MKNSEDFKNKMAKIIRIGKGKFNSSKVGSHFL